MANLVKPEVGYKFEFNGRSLEIVSIDDEGLNLVDVNQNKPLKLKFTSPNYEKVFLPLVSEEKAEETIDEVDMSEFVDEGDEKPKVEEAPKEQEEVTEAVEAPKEVAETKPKTEAPAKKKEAAPEKTTAKSVSQEDIAGDSETIDVLAMVNKLLDYKGEGSLSVTMRALEIENEKARVGSIFKELFMGERKAEVAVLAWCYAHKSELDLNAETLGQVIFGTREAIHSNDHITMEEAKAVIEKLRTLKGKKATKEDYIEIGKLLPNHPQLNAFFTISIPAGYINLCWKKLKCVKPESLTYVLGDVLK